MSNERDVLDRKCRTCGQIFQMNAAQIKAHATKCAKEKK